MSLADTCCWLGYCWSGNGGEKCPGKLWDAWRGPTGLLGCGWTSMWAPICVVAAPIHGRGFWPAGSEGRPGHGRGQSLTDKPGGDEAMCGSHIWVCCAPLCRWSKTCQQSSRGTRGQNFPVAVSPRRSRSPSVNAQLLAREEILYLSAEDLMKGHVS